MAISELVQAATGAPSAMGLTEADNPVTKSSRLIDLPAELRLQIWELVFAQTSYSIAHPKNTLNTHPEPSQPSQAPSDKNTVALLKVNRLIHAETRLLPFQLGSFSVLDHFSWYMGTIGWTSYFTYHNNVLYSLQDLQRREIRHLQLKVDDSDVKFFICREYRHEYSLATRSNQDDLRGLRQAYRLLTRMNEGEEVVGLQEDIGHWIAGHLSALPALEVVMVGFRKVAVDRKGLLLPEPERRPEASARTG